MKDFLQGKTLGHPLHPFLVHFPIALFIFSFVLDLARLVWPAVSGLREGAFCSMAAGVVLALVAAIPGFVDYSDIRRDHPARNVATLHLLLNLLAVGVYAVNLGVRHHQASRATEGLLPWMLSFAGLALLAVSGHLGGKLIFDEGISVGRHRRKTRLPQQTLTVSPSQQRDAQGFVRVASAEEVGEGETLRLDVGGTVLVVAKSGGRFFAFQEFCTHRFGPLSEGCIRGTEVECPWHRSVFEMQTGKVLQGPAKVDLKVFPVRVERGDVLVSVKV